MKNYLKEAVLKSDFSPANEKQTIDFNGDDKLSTRKVIVLLTALLMTLPLITALLLLWFNLK